MANKILFVDDSPVIRKVVKRAVESIKCEFLEACDGKEALALLTKDCTDVKLILSDWNMPVMNGFDFLTAIKASGLLKHIPVIMLTTEAEKSNINKALQAGATSYLLKPVNTDALIKKMTKFVEE